MPRLMTRGKKLTRSVPELLCCFQHHLDVSQLSSPLLCHHTHHDAERRPLVALFGVSSLYASGARVRYQSSDRARTCWTPLDLCLRQPKPSSKMNRICRRSESKGHDVIARQQARAEFADFHLDEMSMIITEPDLLKRRTGFDLKVVIDTYRHHLLRFVCTANSHVQPHQQALSSSAGSKGSARRSKMRSYAAEGAKTWRSETAPPMGSSGIVRSISSANAPNAARGPAIQ